MSYKLHFRINELPKMMNGILGKAHWAHFKREKDEWLSRVSAHTAGKRPATPLKKARLALVRASSIEPDWDGLVSGFKRIVDALVVLKILEDDKMSVIGQPSYRWVKAKPKQGYVEVTVEGEE